MTLEPATMAVGKLVSEKIGRLWLTARSSRAEQSKDLVELIRSRFPDFVARRRTELQFADIALSVTARILTVCGQEYGSLSEEDKAAVLAEVGKTLTEADLSDEAIFAADADANKLVGRIQASLPGCSMLKQLGESGARLYDVVLSECLDCIIRIVRTLPSFGQRATPEILSRLSGISDQVVALLRQLPARTLDAPSGTDADDDFTHRYLAHISRALDQIEMFGVAFERFRPRTTLSVAYISLSVSAESTGERRKRRYDIGPSRWDSDDHTATVRVESALGQGQLMLIRGEAGAGKSTLLRWLAITAARGAFTAQLAEWNGCIPFMIKLRSYADRSLPAPDEFLEEGDWPLAKLKPEAWVHRCLASGRALLLVDGVDELAGPQRRQVREWLTNLLDAYPNVRIVVTSRPAAVSTDWLKTQGFNSAFLEKMSAADTRALIRHWHLAVRECEDLPWPVASIPGYEASLLKHLEAVPHLRMLATNPLLAAMLCALNLDRATQLPPDRMGVYAAALELLLERRDSERRIPSYKLVSLEREQKVQVLQYLAYRLSFTNRVELPRDVAERLIVDKLAVMPRLRAEPKDVLDYLLDRSGLIREPVQNRIDFVHRTVQEYLTAKQIAHDGDLEPLINVAHLDQWWETVIMTIGHANAPLRLELLEGLFKRMRSEPRNARQLKLLVAACQETLSETPRAVLSRIETCIADLIPPRNRRSVRSLANVGETILDRLPRDLSTLSSASACATVRTAQLIRGPRSLELLEGYTQDSRSEVHSELANGWAYFDANEYVDRVLKRLPSIPYIYIFREAQQAALSRLPSVKRLAYGIPYVDCNNIASQPQLELLDVQFAHRIKGLSALPSLGSLKELRIRSYRSITPRSLQCIGRLVNIEKLFLGSKISNLEFISGLHKLQVLSLEQLYRVANYAPLRNLTNLRSLSLLGCQELQKLDDLPALKHLHNLTLNGARLDCDLPDLVGRMPRLTSLYLTNASWVRDLTPLPSRTLRYLSLWSCENIEDFSPIAHLATLKYLDLESTSISDLSILRGLAKLETLYLSRCTNVSDLSPLVSLPRLKDLHIDGISQTLDIGMFENRDITIWAGRNQSIGNEDLLAKRIVRRH